MQPLTNQVSKDNSRVPVTHNDYRWHRITGTGMIGGIGDSFVLCFHSSSSKSI